MSEYLNRSTKNRIYSEHIFDIISLSATSSNIVVECDDECADVTAAAAAADAFQVLWTKSTEFMDVSTAMTNHSKVKDLAADKIDTKLKKDDNDATKRNKEAKEEVRVRIYTETFLSGPRDKSFNI